MNLPSKMEIATLPEEAPVMPLPGAVLFPRALLPLYIFEPRYREMLAHALTQDRMFCAALLRPGRPDWKNEHDFFSVATIGLIRASVVRADGTSNLVLQGLERVRFTRFAGVHPFPLAQITPLETEPSSSVESEALGAKVLDLYSKFKGTTRELPANLERYLSELDDFGALADLMAGAFIIDPLRRQQVLEELDLKLRLRLVIKYLSDETGADAA